MNKAKIALALAAFALPLPLSAPVSAQAAAQSELSDLQRKALDHDLAYRITEGLTTEVGPRMAATEAEARARDWAVRELTRLGFADVRIEPFMMPSWVRGDERAEIVAPFPQKLAVAALGNSASTGDEGLEAEIAYFPTLADLRAAPDGSLKGKIAFVSHAMGRTQDGSSYGAFGPARFVGPDIAAKKGAAGIVIRSVGTDYHRNPHTGATNFSAGTAAIPAGALSVPDAENLERMIARADGPVRMKLTLTPRNLGQQASGNVVAELLGRDGSLPAVLIACHLDSWDLGTGAIDDAAGCGIIAAAAKLIAEEGQPLRTIRLLWAGAEEVGVFGGKAYAEAHGDDPHALVMESDFGAGRVWRVNFLLPEAKAPLADRIAAALAPLGIGRGTQAAGGGADTGAIKAAQNLAAVDLNQDGTRYFDLHHTPDDTFDKIDPEEMAQNVAAWATVLSIVANEPGDFALPAKE